jgi:hypothetical protein
MKTDIKTIGLTPEADQVAERLKNIGAFKEKQDAARFAIAVAINEGISSGRTEGTDTRYASHSFDNGELAALVATLYPNARETPFRMIEHLMNQGLLLIEKRGINRVADVVKLMEDIAED